MKRGEEEIKRTYANTNRLERQASPQPIDGNVYILNSCRADKLVDENGVPAIMS